MVHSKYRTVAAFAMAVLCAGCDKPAPKANPAAPASSEIVMSGVTGGSFQDFRVHLISITSNGSRLDITAVSQPWLDSHIVFIDTLTQGNGREITFDCTAIADKIIDPKMVAEITPLCAQAHDMAKKYWESQRDGAPDSFTDSNGVYWKRAN